MLFFFDRNMPKPLARMLNEYHKDDQVLWLEDRFAEKTDDVVWLKQLAQWDPRPVVVSGDGRILKNPAQRQVLGGLPLTFVSFADRWVNLPWGTQAWKVVKVWPKVVEAARCTQPTVFNVRLSGDVVDAWGATSKLMSLKKR